MSKYNCDQPSITNSVENAGNFTKTGLRARGHFETNPRQGALEV